MMRLKKRFTFVIFGSLGVCLLTVLGMVVYGINRPEKSIAQKQQVFTNDFQTYHAQFVKDQHAFSQHPIFAKHHNLQDAGAYLNAALIWKNQEEVSKPIQTFLMIPTALQQALTRTSQAWTEMVGSGLTAEVDFSWFSELARYDHWDLYSYGPNAELYSKQPLASIDKKIPVELKLLTDWAKLRMIFALEQNALESGLHHLEQLARLLYTTEDYVLALLAPTIIGIGHEALAYANSHELDVPEIKLDQWGKKHKMMRMIWVLPNYHTLITDLTFSNQLQSFQIGKCIALSEGIQHHHIAFQDSLARTFPTYYQQTDLLLEKSTDCRLKHLRRIWNNQDYIHKHKAKSHIMAKVPILGNYFSKLLANVVLVNRWPIYSQDT